MLVIFLFSSPSLAVRYNADVFAKIPVLHEGRIKPMDSFARAALKKLSGREAHALPWLMETIFNPALAETHQVLRIRNPDVLNMLDIEKGKGGLFSYKEVSAALSAKQDIVVSILRTPEKDWTFAQRDLIALQENTVFLGDLLASFSLFLPLSVTLDEGVLDALKPYAGRSLTYLDVMAFDDVLRDVLVDIFQAKGQDIETYTASEQKLAYFSFVVSHLREAGEKSKSLRVFPVAGEEGDWLSPWAFIFRDTRGEGDEAPFFQYWADLALAYHDKDPVRWEAVSQKIYAGVSGLEREDVRVGALEAERLYNLFKPFYMSVGFYGFALLLLTVFMFLSHKILMKSAYFSLLCGAFFHAVGIAARVYILQRPPVSTLYESILFVALVVVLYGLWAYRKDHRVSALFLSAGAGVVLHFLGFSHDQNSDNFLMLTAVLNTNFWLSTHVICITLGYAFCLITSFLAHYALVQTVLRRAHIPDSQIFQNIHTVALIGLLFSAVGTVLGGIWADQSWGRFWGWDPKENGALLIVLWLVWLLHGRVSGQMKPLFVMAGLAYLSVIVALSWFGVNLLNVGLHAYGFSSSEALSLAIFVGVDTVFIASLLCFIRVRNVQQS